MTARRFAGLQARVPKDTVGIQCAALRHVGNKSAVCAGRFARSDLGNRACEAWRSTRCAAVHRCSRPLCTGLVCIVMISVQQSTCGGAVGLGYVAARREAAVRDPRLPVREFVRVVQITFLDCGCGVRSKFNKAGLAGIGTRSRLVSS